MKLIQTLERPVDSMLWDGGAKQVFEWSIIRLGDKYARIGAWEANHLFTIKRGKSDKLTLSYAKQHLRRVTRIPSTFRYEEVKQ